LTAWCIIPSSSISRDPVGECTNQRSSTLRQRKRNQNPNPCSPYRKVKNLEGEQRKEKK